MNRNLSDDVRLVGDTLGHVLRAHGGEALYARVEAMRNAAKEARDADDDGRHGDAQAARADLAREAADLGPDSAGEVARAFTLYFQLVNQAEDVQRARELRRREVTDGPESVGESLHAVVARLEAEGASADQVLEALRRVKLTYVFTAHPTEARRRTTERLLADVRRSLVRRDREYLTPIEHRAEDRRLRAAVESLWEHAAQRRKRPEVLEEVKAGLWYLRHVLLDVVPRLHRQLGYALEASYGAIDPIALPMSISFGSWMGSDRDGNPFVSDAVTERTLELQRWIVLDHYRADLDALVDPLSAVARRLPAHAGLSDALVRAGAAVPESVMEADRRNPDEPLRRLLTFVRERVERTRTFASGAYPGPEAFIDDLLVMRSALQAAQARALPDDLLLDLINRVRCFGFHLAALDVREDSGVHRRVVGELLDDPDYPTRSVEERRESLKRLRLPERSATLSREALRLLDLFATIHRLQARFGPESIGTYAISMTKSAADVLEVLRLAELHRLDSSLDIVPLLETPSDLEQAGTLLDDLLANHHYRSHVAARSDVQELLVGYSDSMKQGGILGSRVRVADAQRAAAGACEKHGVTLRVFHGRGGSVSRGGGPTHRAIGALPRVGFSGQMKITEQGEMRAFNFASPDLAVRYLEQTLGAALVARYEAAHAPPPRLEHEASTLESLADVSQQAYQEMLADPGLIDYFHEATPFVQISALTMASRPAKRRDGRAGLSELRAIPWVFSWSQSRHVLTGWFGVGTALREFAESSGNAELLSDLYHRSRFGRDLIDNVEMTLAKTDLHIAARYADLCTDADVAERVLGRVREEFARTCEMILRLTGQSRLLDDDPVLRTSIRMRNPYVDPLSYLQVEALRRLREQEDPAERAVWERVARIAVQGIAAGLRHTG